MKPTNLIKITSRLLIAALLAGTCLWFGGCSGGSMSMRSDFVNGGRPYEREW